MTTPPGDLDQGRSDVKDDLTSNGASAPRSDSPQPEPDGATEKWFRSGDAQTQSDVRAVETAVEVALATIRTNIAHFGGRYPDDTTTAGVYQLRPGGAGHAEGANWGWTTGFCPGLFWLAWELSGDLVFQRAGLAEIDRFADRIEHHIDVETHDLGFLYTLAGVAPWRLLGGVSRLLTNVGETANRTVSAQVAAGAIDPGSAVGVADKTVDQDRSTQVVDAAAGQGSAVEVGDGAAGQGSAVGVADEVDGQGRPAEVADETVDRCRCAAVAPVEWEALATAQRAALAAADHLMTRFLEPAGIIQAWGDLADPAQRGRTIIDSLMNMPLLYWASQVTGEAHYEAAARRHVTQLRDHIIRPDGTTFHTYHWDPVTGQPLRGTTAQGYADDSCWSRGQAWGILGFALSHRYTGDHSYLAAATQLADYFLDHLPADSVPYWDLVFSDGSDAPRDSSAGAIAACGLDELIHGLRRQPDPDGELHLSRQPAGPDVRAHLGRQSADPVVGAHLGRQSAAPVVGAHLGRQWADPDGGAERIARYAAARDKIVTSLMRDYAVVDGPPGSPLIQHGVYDWPKRTGVDEGNLWGDYFYVEALRRVTDPQWDLYW